MRHPNPAKMFSGLIIVFCFSIRHRRSKRQPWPDHRSEPTSNSFGPSTVRVNYGWLPAKSPANFACHIGEEQHLVVPVYTVLAFISGVHWFNGGHHSTFTRRTVSPAYT